MIGSVLRHCADNKKRELSVLTRVGHQIVNKGKSVPLQARGAHRVQGSYKFARLRDNSPRWW